MMKTNSKQIDLFSELAAIRNGGCVWCKLGFKHPVYSKCHANPMLAKQAVAHPVIDFNKTQVIDRISA